MARDQEYFKAKFFSGDRPSNLGQVKTPEGLRFPNDDGFLFNHVRGKTITDGDQNVFRIHWNPQVLICSMKGIELYTDVARQIGINLTISYLFCPTTTDNGMRDEPLSTTTAEARLKLYLREMKANEGKMLHGFRSGCAITLALTGTDLSEIIEHVSWARRHTAFYYLQLAKVLNPSVASARLAETSVERGCYSVEGYKPV